MMSQRKADGLLAMVAMIWGSSYLLGKIGLGGLGIYSLITLRFGIAFLVTALVFRKRLRSIDKRTLGCGAMLGGTLFLFFVLQYMGLRTTPASSAGFLTSTAVVFILLIQTVVTRRIPTIPVILGTGLTLLGIACLTLNGSFSMEPGALLCLAGAFVYGCQIVLTRTFAQTCDGILLGILELGFTTIYSYAAGMLFDTIALPSNASGWIAVLGMAVGCSAIGFILQPMALQHTTAERAGILMSLEPVCSALYAFLFFHEVLSVQGYFGAVLVICGVLVSGRTERTTHQIHRLKKRILLSWLTNKI